MMRNIVLSLFVLVCVSCNQVTSVDNEIDFRKSLLSKFGQPEKIDTSIVDLSTSKIRYVNYIYKKESPNEDILPLFHDYINKIYNKEAVSLSNELPARYDAEWTDYDSDFEVHLQGGRDRKTTIYSIYVQTISVTKKIIIPSSQTPQTVAPSK